MQLPIVCQRAAFEMMKTVGDAPEDLIKGWAAIEVMDGLDEQQNISRQIDELYEQIRGRVKSDSQVAKFATLHEVLFEEQKFLGNPDNYRDYRKNYLSVTLRSKTGLPVSMSAIYYIIASRLGLNVYGVNLPGHFLVAANDGSGTMFIDPFCGGMVLNPDEIAQIMKQLPGATYDLNQAVTIRQWLTRVLQNLLEYHNTKNDFNRTIKVLELEAALWPDENRLLRDIGLVMVRCDMINQGQWLISEYVKKCPDDPQYLDLKKLLDVLGGQ